MLIEYAILRNEFRKKKDYVIICIAYIIKEVSMQLRKQQHNHLAEINRIMSMYQTLSCRQLFPFFPELPHEKVMALLKRLHKAGRLVLLQDEGLVLLTKDCSPNPDILSAFWVLLDFLPDIIYHTVSDFPAVLTFYTNSDAYDVIHVAEGKENLMNQVLSEIKENAPHRLVIVDLPRQISHLIFPGICAFCTVDNRGIVQYYKTARST